MAYWVDDDQIQLMLLCIVPCCTLGKHLRSSIYCRPYITKAHKIGNRVGIVQCCLLQLGVVK